MKKQGEDTRKKPDAPASDCYRQRFDVAFDYPVYFTRGLFSPENPVFEELFRACREGRPHRVQVYVDSGVVEAQPGFLDMLNRYFAQRADLFDVTCEPGIVQGGERAKNGWHTVQHIMTAMGDHHLCRRSFIIAIGGGSMLDMVGFAASLVHRGVRLVRVPTTVLAQNDAGVGVKNGMDEHGMKNFVGTFAPPFAVFNDFDFLATLEDAYWFGGIAEAFKVAIIKDAAFFETLCDLAGGLRRRDAEAIAEVVRRCAILHLEHIRTSGDPFEKGAARPLDFGHWSAHKLEVLSQHRIGHGQAVSVGIALDSVYAARVGLLSEDELRRILAAMAAVGLPTWDERLDLRFLDGRLQILAGLEEFREHLGGTLTVTLPNHIGSRIEVHEMDEALLAECVARLKDPASVSACANPPRCGKAS